MLSSPCGLRKANASNIPGEGISTGLACGAQFANILNILLRELDAIIAASFCAEIALDKWYIDEILIVFSYSLQAVLTLSNAFDTPSQHRLDDRLFSGIAPKYPVLEAPH